MDWMGKSISAFSLKGEEEKKQVKQERVTCPFKKRIFLLY